MEDSGLTGAIRKCLVVARRRWLPDRISHERYRLPTHDQAVDSHARFTRLGSSITTLM